MTLRRFAPLLALSLTIIPLHTAPSGAAPARDWQAKIHPQVLATIASGRPARIIVRMQDTGDLSAARSIADKGERRIAVVREKQQVAERTQAPLLRILGSARAAGKASSFHSFWVANAIGAEAEGAVVRALAAQPGVERIDPDRRRHIIRPRASNPAADSSPGWNVDLVDAPAAWDLGILGEGAVVANLDTGADPTHPSIATRFRGAGGDVNYAWFDGVNGQDAPYDDNGHGTHTMGTMVGGDGPGPDTNDIGVAPGATWIAAKAFDEWGSGADSWILDAAQFLAAPTKLDGTGPDPELAPDVVNNSWGGGQCDNWFDEVMQTWRAMEIFPAFAIGNWGPDEGSASSPGDSVLAFSVGATDSNDQIAEFSSRGPTCDDRIKPEISAPGQDVNSSLPGGEFGEFSGTSMATPHVAGAVALLLDASAGSLTVSEMEVLLREEALDLGATGEDNSFGAGRLQIGAAVEIALQGVLVRGTVVDEGTTPIPGARLTFEGLDRTRRVVSRSDGTYRARLLPGTYLVGVRAFGYLPYTTSLIVPEIGDELINDITLILAPITTISGTVVEGPTGAPQSGATVSVLDTPLAPVLTALDGTFSIDVPAGAYDVRASAGNCLEQAEANIDALPGPVDHTFTLARKLDGFGYVCDNVAFVNEPGTTKLDLSGWEEQLEVELPFAFPFYGEDVSQVWVTTAGYVTATEGLPTLLNSELPSEAGPNGAMYLLWDALFVRGSARGVYTATLGTEPERRFVIEYRNFEMDETGDLVNASLVLFENGTIEMRYRSLEGTAIGKSATVGIENISGSSALQYSADNAVLSDETAIRYSIGGFGRVEGIITSAVDGLPVEGAVVTAGTSTSTSAADGSYRIAAFPQAQDLTVEASGYEAFTSVQAFTYGSPTTLDVVLDAPGLSVTPLSLTFDVGEAGPQQISISNPGNRLLSFRALESHALLETIISDPVGDMLRPPVDLVDIQAAATDELARFSVLFSGDTDMEYAGGYLQLDTDQDPSTGIPVGDQYGSPGQDIGIDYFVTLFDLPYSGEVYLWDENYEYVAFAPASVDGTRVLFEFPLADLGGDDGAMDVTSNVGDYEPLDWAPDSGHGTIGGGVDVPWLGVEPAEGELEPGGAATLDVTVDPTGLTSGIHEAQIIVRSNAPRNPKVVIPVTIAVEDVRAPTTTIATPTNSLVVRPAGDRINGTATDSGSGIQVVLVEFSSALGTSVETAAVTCNGSGTECTWEVVGPQTPFLYEVRAWSEDRDGHVETPGASATIALI